MIVAEIIIGGWLDLIMTLAVLYLVFEIGRGWDVLRKPDDDDEISS